MLRIIVRWYISKRLIIRPKGIDYYLGTSQDNLARDEDKQHDLGLDHAVNETREQLRLVLITRAN